MGADDCKCFLSGLSHVKTVFISCQFFSSFGSFWFVQILKNQPKMMFSRVPLQLFDVGNNCVSATPSAIAFVSLRLFTVAGEGGGGRNNKVEIMNEMIPKN